jgi:hypothetical protein
MTDKSPKDDKKKTAALKTNLPVVKSSPLPTTRPKRAYRDFDDFMGVAERLDRLWYMASDALKFVKNKTVPVTERLQLAQRWIADLRSPEFLQRVRKFDADWQFYERDELYDNPEKCERVLTRRFIGEQLALMLACINQKPQDKKLYARMLIEEVIAANPRAVTLEATSREIRRTKTYLPSIAELLNVLHPQEEKWDGYVELGEDTFDGWRRAFEKAIPELKAEQAEQEAEQKREQERREKWEAERLEREAREAREQEERQARLEREREQRDIAQMIAKGEAIMRRHCRELEAECVWYMFQIMLMARRISIPGAVLVRLWAESQRTEMRIAIGRAVKAGLSRRANDANSDEDVTDMWKAVALKANGHDASP